VDLRRTESRPHGPWPARDRKAAAHSRFSTAVSRFGNGSKIFRTAWPFRSVGGRLSYGAGARYRGFRDGRLCLSLCPGLDHPGARGPAGAPGLSRADPVAPPHPFLCAAFDLVGIDPDDGRPELVGELRP